MLIFGYPFIKVWNNKNTGLVPLKFKMLPLISSHIILNPYSDILKNIYASISQKSTVHCAHVCQLQK